MAHIEGRARVYVLFLQPSGFPATWDKTDLWDSAAAIPGVTVLGDPDGANARRFGAMTSGHTLLYSAQGELLFSGGITLARGHFGDRAGRSAILAMVDRAGAAPVRTRIFGCLLDGRASR